MKYAEDVRHSCYKDKLEGHACYDLCALHTLKYTTEVFHGISHGLAEEEERLFW